MQTKNGSDSRKPTQEDAIRLGRQMFLSCERIEVGALAARLGISRITIYRWLGNRDRLVGEVIWSLLWDTLQAARQKAEAAGQVDFYSIYLAFNEYLNQSRALVHFLREEPQFALRLLTRPDSDIRGRLLAAFEEMLEEEVERRGAPLELDSATLAYVIVCIGESYIYPRIAVNSPPDLNQAASVVKLLLR